MIINQVCNSCQFEKSWGIDDLIGLDFFRRFMIWDKKMIFQICPVGTSENSPAIYCRVADAGVKIFMIKSITIQNIEEKAQRLGVTAEMIVIHLIHKGILKSLVK